MEAADKSSGYGKPPWIFKGSALYQLHLVKSETARLFIPKELKLLEAFGYTLGGFFLAKYQDSPVGVFDELVVLAGTVRDPPSSCAWAARVLVNNDDACNHGRKEIGLPSQVAKFSQRITAVTRQQRSNFCGILSMIGLGPERSIPRDCTVLEVKEICGSSATDICNINLPSNAPEFKLKWMGLPTEMSLPSFSGHTEYNCNLLKYSCDIRCRMKLVRPVRVSGPSLAPKHDKEDSSTGEMDIRRNLSISILLSKPILALEFSRMIMQVAAPVIISEAEPIQNI